MTSIRTADYQRAKNEAERLLKHNHISDLPIDLEEIAESEGLSIAVADFEEQEISGFIHFEKKLIVVNKFDSLTRQRFTIAHELGHWVLHQSEINQNRDIVVLYRKTQIDNQDDPLEQEANCFAANLLVPISLLEELNKSTKDNKSLAKTFLVSEAMMAYRKGLLDGKR